MIRMDLSFDVDKQMLSRTDSESVVNLSDSYLRLCFNFKSEDWTGLTKFVLVFHAGKVTRCPLVNDKMYVPGNLLGGDRLVFSLYGVDTSVRVTTNKLKVYLFDSGFTTDYDNDEAETFSLDVLEEIYLAINTHTHVLANVTDCSTVEMDVVYEDNTTDSFNVVVK